MFQSPTGCRGHPNLLSITSLRRSITMFQSPTGFSGSPNLDSASCCGCRCAVSNPNGLQWLSQLYCTFPNGFLPGQFQTPTGFIASPNFSHKIACLSWYAVSNPNGLQWLSQLQYF